MYEHSAPKSFLAALQNANLSKSLVSEELIPKSVQAPAGLPQFVVEVPDR